MAESVSYYRGLFNEMLDEDGGRNEKYRAIDKMWHNEWDLPGNLKALEWMRKVVSTDPSDALSTAIRVLSTVWPKFNYLPLAPGDANLQHATNIERGISWNLKQASRRRRNDVVRSIVQSALMYDMVASQLVHLPYQTKILKSFDGSKQTKRLAAAQRLGTFSVVVHNPQNVHARFSDYMLENVLLARVMKLTEFYDFWGKRAQDLWEAVDQKDRENTWVSAFDYMDLDSRVVLAYKHQESTLADPKQGPNPYEIMVEDDVPDFIPWAIKMGGSDLETDPSFQVRPLLDTVYAADQWTTQNVAESIMVSEVISYAAAPRMVIQAPDGRRIEVDYGDVNRPLEVPPGSTVQQLSPPGMDQNLAAVVDRFGARMNKSTVARFLQNLDFPSGTAFATINAVIQSAANALEPYKKLAEDALAEMATQMLYWVHLTEEPLIAFGEGEKNRGEQLVITPDDFEVERIYFSVDLTTHVPTDHMQRINAAVMMNERLNYPRRRALDDLDVSDPDAALEEWLEEDMTLQVYRQQMQMQQAMQQLQFQQAAMAAQQPAQQSPMTTAEGNAPAFQNVGGQGFNPAMGGSPPGMTAPPMTREFVTGRDRTGAPLQEL